MVRTGSGQKPFGRVGFDKDFDGSDWTKILGRNVVKDDSVVELG